MNWDRNRTIKITIKASPIFRFELELPPRELDPNVRSHWAKKANAKKKYRKSSALVMLSSLNAIDGGQLPLMDAGISIQWFAARNKPKDPDNIIAHCKTAIDALEDAEVLTNDRFVKWITSEWQHRKNNPGLELTVYKINKEDTIESYVKWVQREGSN